MMRRRTLAFGARYAIVGSAAIAFIFPFYWMLVTSLNRRDTVFDVPPLLWPQWQFQNYVETWQTLNWSLFFTNTVIVVGGRILLVLATSALAGYAFAAMDFRGKSLLFASVIAMFIIPDEVRLVPNFIILKYLGWLDSYQAQFVPYGATVIGIFLMRQFFLTLPKELWEAAQLDGTSHLRYLWSIALPLSRPALVTLALLQFVDGWNAFLWPLIVTSTDAKRPIQVALAYFDAVDSTDPILLAAAALITTLPLLIVFVFAQRQIVGGIAGTGIRG
jgi:multiple sugar transport system permease protein